jgi:hypothetical protein
LSLADSPHQSCEAADVIARTQLRDVKQRIARLRALKRELERMIGQCGHGKVSDCRVIEVLGDHSRCLTDDHSASTPRT